MSETLEDFYTDLLRIGTSWRVDKVTRDSAKQEITVFVSYNEKQQVTCPVCGKPVKIYDRRTRRWRDMDSCRYKTIIEASVPRTNCPRDGVKQINVNWAEKNSRFTLFFEKQILLWLREDPISTVAMNFGISWDEVDGIMQRAVKRGLSRQKKRKVSNIGIDETSFQKRHEYVTVILDKNSDNVIDVLNDRKSETLENWFKTQKKADFTALKSISMDMWDPYIKAVKTAFEEASEIIGFDRFHVAQHFSKALDKVRSREYHELKSEGNEDLLKGTKYHWQRSNLKTDNRTKDRKSFIPLTKMNLKTARAWRIKEVANELWNFTYMGVAERQWKQLFFWMSHSRLKPVIDLFRTIKRYFWGILNAIRMKINNSMLEAKNARIQRIKNKSCGFRNRERFRTAILFHLGGLNMTPVSTQ